MTYIRIMEYKLNSQSWMEIAGYAVNHAYACNLSDCTYEEYVHSYLENAVNIIVRKNEEYENSTSTWDKTVFVDMIRMKLKRLIHVHSTNNTIEYDCLFDIIGYSLLANIMFCDACIAKSMGPTIELPPYNK